MSLPKPVVPLGDDLCSVIFSNTLYTFSAGTFQSLELSPGANWTQLASGESVTGGACVGSPSEFWVVGGQGGNADYQGLQKFTYATGKWESIKPRTLDMQRRIGHGAAYLSDTGRIVVYAGNQDGALRISSASFLIQTSEPYGIWSSPAPAEPPAPALKPMLLPYSATQVALVGGTTDTRVMLFDSGSGWIPSGATLAAPLAKDPSVMKSVILTGDDGSKHLLTFDMSVSPNQVTRSVLIDGKGLPVQNSGIITTRSEERESRRRSRQRSRRQTKALTEADWPKYNSTLAPTSVRTNFALAQDASGLVVAAGGNADDILCVFDTKANSWQDATELLGDQKILAQSVSSTSSSTSSTTSASSTSTSALVTASSTTPASTSATPTPTASETIAPVAAAPQDGMMSANTLLGIVLGSIGGLGAILLIIYICIRRRRAKKQNFSQAAHNRRASGVASGEKGGFGYANDSHPQGPSRGTYRGGHQQQGSQTSFSSMAILMSNVNNQNKSGLGRNNSKDSKRSSTSSIFNKAFKSTISKPIPQMAEQNYASTPTRSVARDERGVAFDSNVAQPRPAGNRPDPQDGTRRSSGWNRYWSGGSALNILGFGNGNGGGNGNGSGNGASKRSTVLSESSQYSNPHRITQDSATVPPLQIPPVMPEAKPQFSRVNSGSPTISRYDPSALGMDGMRGQIERPTSAVSSLSAYSSGIPASVHEAWDPTSMSDSKPWGTERAPSSAYSGNSFTTPLAPASASSNGKPAAPTGVSRQPQLAMAATSSDMSWLNLGEQSRF